jgi:hypothetical protein
MKNKKTLFISFILIFISNYAHADWSYSGKFLATTVAGCAIGGSGSYVYADNTGYDSQPKAIVTWMGAATGCLTGAIFSYFFYDDNSATLNTRINEQQKTIADLSIQLADMQGQKQNGTFNPPPLVGNYPNPFDKLQLKEGVAKQNYDLNNLPRGLNIKNCDKLYQYSLVDDGNDVELAKKSQEIIAVSKKFALVGFTFLYTPNDCFSPSLPGGKYAESYFNGLESFLQKRVINWNANNLISENENK